MLGQEMIELANNEFEAGQYAFKWDGRNRNGIQTSSGLYFYTLQVKSFTGFVTQRTRKMIKLH